MHRINRRWSWISLMLVELMSNWFSLHQLLPNRLLQNQRRRAGAPDDRRHTGDICRSAHAHEPKSDGVHQLRHGHRLWWFWHMVLLLHIILQTALHLNRQNIIEYKTTILLAQNVFFAAFTDRMIVIRQRSRAPVSVFTVAMARCNAASTSTFWLV